MIRSFRDAETVKVFEGRFSKKLNSIAKVAYRKLAALHSATTLQDLALPGNRLEKLSRDREGQHSIRINDQYRICFRWESGDAFDVEIVDYH